MSKKRKAELPVEPKVKPEEMSFRVFFHSCVAKGLVQPWQEKEIHAFFKDLGLKEKEPTDSYKDALAKY